MKKVILFFCLLANYCQAENIFENLKIIAEDYQSLNTPDEQLDYLIERELTEVEINSIINLVKVDWKTQGQAELPLSHSLVKIPEGYGFAVGENAQEYYGRANTETANVEGYAHDNTLDHAVVFEYFDTGYITIDDWDDLDSDALLKDIIDNTETDNKQKKKKGISDVHVIGWILQPTLDKTTSTVYWVLEAKDVSEEDNFVNSVAIRLGRKGYEKLTWITSKSLYLEGENHLNPMLAAHTFEDGYKYSDYQIGDKVAAYGIAALVASTVGAKVFKAFGIGLILKKIAGFVLPVLAALFYKFKSKFKSLFSTNK